jgi:hypothetical protein
MIANVRILSLMNFLPGDAISARDSPDSIFCFGLTGTIHLAPSA